MSNVMKVTFKALDVGSDVVFIDSITIYDCDKNYDEIVEIIKIEYNVEYVDIMSIDE